MGDKYDSSKQPLLVAVDFSKYSEAALIWAAKTARSFRAPLVVLHVVHDPGSAPGYYQLAKKRKKHLKRIEDVAGDMMTEFLESATKEHPRLLGEIDHRMVVGLPVTRILEMAKEIDAQMIVMGSRGRTGLSRFMLGSKAERVVQLSEIPVTIIKGSDSKGSDSKGSDS